MLLLYEQGMVVSGLVRLSAPFGAKVQLFYELCKFFGV